MSPDQVWEMCRVPSSSRRTRGPLSGPSGAPSFSHTYLCRGEPGVPGGARCAGAPQLPREQSEQGRRAPGGTAGPAARGWGGGPSSPSQRQRWQQPGRRPGGARAPQPPRSPDVHAGVMGDPAAHDSLGALDDALVLRRVCDPCPCCGGTRGTTGTAGVAPTKRSAHPGELHPAAPRARQGPSLPAAGDTGSVTVGDTGPP